MISISKAKESFNKYTSNFDMTNPKISLKYAHTFRVSAISRQIALSLKLNKEEVQLAQLIGMLHDIARFEQATIYNTFSDQKSYDHGNRACEILFENNFIREFIETDIYDEVIKKAIYSHNKINIENNYNDQELLFSKIIRDADKLDILYLTSIGHLKTVDPKSSITPIVYEATKEHNLVDFKDVKTELDHFILSMALIYDLNFPFSLKYLREKNYLETSFNNLKIVDIEVIKQLQEIKKELDNHLIEGVEIC